ncbi:hypothetical protein D779_0103 [Imhoffiella purpurea]|uniref:DUF4412 domain-containing protein n=2 Tax=Imhoffiella purpurea TaxID=1249627 RepID=W9VK92_9GAMM|nr:hypothetical protein D779_0103 [Imhoffiella purpurea]
MAMLAGLASASSEAALVVTESLDGEMQTRIYHQGVYYELEEGRLLNRIDLAHDRCLMVNHEAEVYFEGACEGSLDELMATMKAEFDRQLASLTPEQREQMQAMVGAMIQGSGRGEVGFERDGAGKVAGYDAESYRISVNDVPYSRVWVSADLEAAIGKEFDLDAYRRWDRRMREEMDAMTHRLGGQEKGADPMAETFDAILAKGYLVKVAPNPGADMMGMMVPSTIADEASEEIEVLSVEQDPDFRPESLNPPGDYRELSSWTQFMQVDIGSEEHDDQAHD